MHDADSTQDPTAPAAAPLQASDPWRWAPLLLVAVAWLAHASARTHGWVLDDVHLVRDNPVVARGPSAIPQILAQGAYVETPGVEHGLHGPVAIASFALEAPLWRGARGALRPSGFHLTNLLLHGLCVLLLFRVLLAYAPRRPVLALGAALVFAAHPLHTGAVSALMGRAVLLAALFSLGTALAWRRFDGRRPTWLPVAACLWLLALLAHPVALGVPLVLAILDRATSAGAARPRGAVLGLAVFAVPLAVFHRMGGALGSAMVTAGDMPLQGLGTRLLVGIEGFGRLLLALVIPTGLRGDHADEALPGVGYSVDAGTWVAVALLLVTLAWVLWLVRRRQAGAGSVTLLAALALMVPAAAALPAGATLEGRWAYVIALPLMAYAGMLAEGLLRAAGASAGFARARTALVWGLVVVCLMGLSLREAAAWRDDDAFHQHLLDRNPRHVGAMVRYAESRRLAAIRMRDESMQLRATDPERDHLLRGSSAALGQADQWSVRAVRHELGRRRADAWRVRGLILLSLNQSATALRALEQARDLDPLLKQSPQAMLETFGVHRLERAATMYVAIGKAREALGESELAADAFVTASALAPERVDLIYRAGMALCRVQRYAEGLTRLLEARRRTSDPTLQKEIDDAIHDSREAARRIARGLLDQGHAAQRKEQMRKAITFYEQATEANPASVEAWMRAGWLRGHWFGNYEQATLYLGKAEALLRKGKIAADDPRWTQLTAFRKLLAEQRATEDAELEGDG